MPKSHFARHLGPYVNPQQYPHLWKLVQEMDEQQLGDLLNLIRRIKDDEGNLVRGKYARLGIPRGLVR